MDSVQLGTALPEHGTPVPPARKLTKRELTWRFLTNTVHRVSAWYGGTKRLAAATERTDRAVRYWRNGEKEMGGVDLLMAAHACKDFRARVVAFLHLPEHLLHRADAEIDAQERQADALVCDAHATLARLAGEEGQCRCSMVARIASAAWGLTPRLRFRRRKQEAA